MAPGASSSFPEGEGGGGCTPSGQGCLEGKNCPRSSEVGERAGGTRMLWRSLHPQDPNSGPVCGPSEVGAQAGLRPAP